MSKPNCYLCASDEGILLDIFGDAGKIFRENIETCLSVKVKQGETRSTKICHRCAYELESCSRFLEKYRRSKDSRGAAACPKEEYCNLCAVTRDKAHLLRVNGGNSLKNSLCKIGQVIKEDLFKDKVADFAVCLDCRYNVDLLFDLRSVYGETPKKLQSLGENGLSTSDLPKTRTSVILRKTTYIPLPRLNGDRNSDASTASSDTMSLKRKRGKPRKESVGTGAATALAVHFRSCEQCDTQVEHGIDMYRYHRTGLTVCKECWLTMDPERVSSGKRKRLAQIDPEGGTKLCAVFLKDVLTNPSKYKNIYKLEKDEHGNTTFLITDESSENEDKTPPKRTRGRPSTSSLATLEGRKAPKRQSLAKRNEEETPKRGRPATRRSIEPPESPPIAKAKVKNGVADVDSTPTTTMRTRTRRGSAEPSKVASASPELRGSGVKKPSTKKSVRPPKITSAKRASSGDEKSQTRAESSLNAARTDVDTQRITRARKTSTPEQPTKRISRRTRSNSFTDPVTAEPLVTRRLAALSEEPSEETPIVVDATTPKISKTRPKIAKSDSELEKPYECAVCQAGYANKLIGKAHELTHEKQPEVKLRRVVVPPETIAEETLPEASGKESEVANEPCTLDDKTEVANESCTLDGKTEVANESCTLDGKTEVANESCTLDGKTEVANESCTLDGKTEEHDEKPSIEEEKARSVTPHITENKHDPEETSDTSTLIIDNEKIAGDNNEKDERDESDETEVSLALRDTSDDESARTEKDGERMNGDENEAPDDRNEEVSGKNNVHENREKDEKTKDDVDESPRVTEPREIEDIGVTTCDEPKEMEVSKPNVNTTSAEDIEPEATKSSQVTLPNKMELVDDEKVENCAVETVPPMDDEPVKNVENIREIGADSEENLKNAVAAKPEVNEPVNDCTVTMGTATERPRREAQSDGKIDDESVEEEKMDEKKTEQEEEEEEIKETKEITDKEDVGGVKEKSEEKKELAEQEKENEDVRTNDKDEDTEEREEQETKNVEVSKNEKDKDTEERKENEKEVRHGKKDNAEEGEENEMEEVKTNEKKKDAKQRDEKENEQVEENDEKERKKVTEEKDKKIDEEEKEKEDEVEKQEKNEEDKEEENEEAEGKVDAEDKNEAEEEKDTDEREENGQKDEEKGNGAKGKEGDTEKEQKEDNENETEKDNDAIKDEEEAEKTMRKDEEKEDELLGIELCDEPTDESQEGIDAKAESVGVATEVLHEVFDLASAEVKKRLENKNSLEDNCATPETLENISLEIQNSADTPLSERSASNDKS